MANPAPEPIRVSLNAGGTLSVPVEILRAAWKAEGKKAKLYFCREGKRVVIVLPGDLAKYLAERG